MRRSPGVLLGAVLLMPMAVRGPQSVPRLVDGDYLSEPFMKALEATRSLDQALAQTGDPVRARVEARGEDRLITRGSFAEECGAVLVRPDGSQQASGDEPEHPAGMVSVVGSVKFRTRLCTDDDAAFVHVGDHVAWISNVLLGGRYKDPRGGKFVFGPSGQATFAGRRHRYQVPLETWSSRVVLDGVPHAYTLEKGTLRIFELQEDGQPAEEPRWRLRRVITDS